MTLLPETTPPKFETELREQLGAVLFSEGLPRQHSHPHLSDHCLKTLEDERTEVLISSANLYEDYLFGDNQRELITQPNEELVPRGIDLLMVMRVTGRYPEDSRERFLGGLSDETQARKIFSIRIRDNEDLRDTFSYGFYQLRPERFAPIHVGRVAFTATILEGTIPGDTDTLIVGPQGVVEKPEEDPGLQLLKICLPVDISKHNQKREAIRREENLNIKAYAA